MFTVSVLYPAILRFPGYYLATAAEDSVVKLWDLRKLKNFRSIALEDRYEVKALAFDYSGAYLAVAGTDVRWAIFRVVIFTIILHLNM